MKSIACITAVLIVAGTACNGDDDSTQSSADAGAVTSTSSALVKRHDIASDQAGATASDKTLVNAWGLAFNPMGPAWVSSADQGLSEVYDASGKHVIPSVVMPSVGNSTQPASPTGQAFNQDASAFMGDAFIFVTEEGTIAGWQTGDGAKAVQRVDNSNSQANYKGVAIAMSGSGQPRLFAADFHGAKIDVYDAKYRPAKLSADFSDSNLPSGYAPFNVAEVNGALIVTYAKQDADKKDDVKGKGNGFVDIFSVDGKFMSRLVSGGELNAPWGVALAPKGYAAAPAHLLIGNFGDGLIHAYELTVPASGDARAKLVGALEVRAGHALAIDGLWALQFGLDAGGFKSDELYFTAGPGDETHGVFGRLESVPRASGGNTGSGTAGGGGSTVGY